MQKIPLSLAKPGMILARAVLRENGQVLVGEGAGLTVSLLERLEAMGVDAVTVQGRPVQMDGISSGESIAMRLERLEHLFRKHQDDPWMNQVKAQLECFFRAKAAAEEAANAAACRDMDAAAQVQPPAAAGASALLATRPRRPPARRGILARLFKGGAHDR